MSAHGTAAGVPSACWQRSSADAAASIPPRSEATHASASSSSACTSASSERAGAPSRSSASIRRKRWSTARASSMPSTVDAAFSRVCVRIVSKGIRFLPAVALSPDLELGEARAAIDRGDDAAALKRLDRARRGYVKAHDADGLEHVLDMAALVDATDDRTRIGRENLAYAAKQNLRQQSRRRARQAKQPSHDPYPDLQAPAEHTGLHVGRGLKIAIGVGVLTAIALLAAIVAFMWLDDSTPSAKVSLRLVNDTQEIVTVRGCDDEDCVAAWMHAKVPPGLEAERDVSSRDLVTLFKLERPGDDTCLPVRVHDAYERLGGGGALAVRLSRATPCPGTTVLPVSVEPAL